MQAMREVLGERAKEQRMDVMPPRAEARQRTQGDSDEDG